MQADPPSKPAPDPAIECRRAQASDFDALEQMLELYQHELSDIWIQDLDESGRYGYDLSRHRAADRWFAYVMLISGRHAGFALVAPACVTRKEGCWMEQFFVIKRHRRQGVGSALARFVISQHAGPWEIGQMPGNDSARRFWLSVIGQVTSGRFEKTEVTTGWWQGTVQCFNCPAQH